MPPSYTLLTSEADYRRACQTVLGRANHQILIFDRDLQSLGLEETSCLELLAAFLRADAARRIRVVLHDPGPVEKNSPRLMRLIAHFSQVFLVRQSPDNLRHLADAHVLANEGDGLRRFHVDQARSALILDDPADLHPWRRRFEDLWELSHPCLTINTTGL